MAVAYREEEGKSSCSQGHLGSSAGPFGTALYSPLEVLDATNEFTDRIHGSPGSESVGGTGRGYTSGAVGMVTPLLAWLTRSLPYHGSLLVPASADSVDELWRLVYIALFVHLRAACSLPPASFPRVQEVPVAFLAHLLNSAMPLAIEEGNRNCQILPVCL